MNRTMRLDGNVLTFVEEHEMPLRALDVLKQTAAASGESVEQRLELYFHAFADDEEYEDERQEVIENLSEMKDREFAWEILNAALFEHGDVDDLFSCDDLDAVAAPWLAQLEGEARDEFERLVAAAKRLDGATVRQHLLKVITLAWSEEKI